MAASLKFDVQIDSVYSVIQRHVLRAHKLMRKQGNWQRRRDRNDLTITEVSELTISLPSNCVEPTELFELAISVW